MDSPEFTDPYLIPRSNVLRNLVGATTLDALTSAEADLSFARALQLLDSPVAATNDLRELQAIHHHLFQGIYDWAGEVRTVDVRKNVPGADFFLPPLISMFDKVVTQPDAPDVADWSADEIRRHSINPPDEQEMRP